MAFDPWYKAKYPLNALGAKLELRVPHDVFSTLRIDEGTLLLLDHLPPLEPRRVLDMGCGYGALGLPVAARFPNGVVDMVDRDLLAVEWSSKNAESNGLPNAKPFPSLGYRDLKNETPYDWILCNVPARIGTPFIEHLFASGRRRLTADGEIRVVVIRDLGPTVEEIAKRRAWPIVESGRGPRHVVYSVGSEKGSVPADPSDLYARDQVQIGGEAGVHLDRPFDISGDSARLASVLPVLIDVLPRKAPARACFFRCGYGALPLLARKRWPECQVLSLDRDLLATTFARDNAQRLGLSGELLEIRERVDFHRALLAHNRFDLIAGELSPSVGEKVTEMDLVSMTEHLDPQGQALLLTLEKIEREWVLPIAKRRRLSVSRLISRDGNVVLRLTKA